MKTIHARIGAALAAALLSISTRYAAAEPSSREGRNLVVNGDFEGGFHDGIPEGWRFDAWKTEGTVRALAPRPEGGSAFSMSSAGDNDLKLIQSVAVKPRGVYRLSCLAKGKTASIDRKGINLSVVSLVDGSDSLYDTGGEWKEIVVYGRAGKAQSRFELSLRLGGYFSVNSGEASFDDVVVEEVKRVPPGARVIDLEPAKSKGGGGAPPAQADVGVVFLLLVGSLALWLILDRSPLAPALDSGKGERIALASLLALAAAARLPFCFGGFGHATDLPTFKSWADTASSGVFSFYKNAKFADYPPGYLYVLGLLGSIRKIFGMSFSSPVFELTIRLPALAADLVLGLMIYRRAKARSGASRALLFAALFLLNPVSAQNSAVWGQMDSVFLFLSLDRLSMSSPALAGVFYALSVLVKPQGLIFAPVFLWSFVAWRKPKPILICVGSGLAALLAGLLPFMIAMGPAFPFKLYANTLGSYPYATVNAANLWALLGMNYRDIGTRVLGLAAESWGVAAIILVTIASFAVFHFNRGKRGKGDEEFRLPCFETAAFLILSVFVLGTKMHERYLYPFIPLALGAAAGRKSLRTLVPALIASAGLYLNVALIYRLHRAGESAPKALDAQFLSAAALSFLAFVLWPLLANREEPFVRGEPGMPPLPEAFRDRAGWSPIGERAAPGEARRDAIGLALIVAICLGAGFAYFADRAVPSRPWSPAAGAEARIDLGAERDVERMSWYCGIGEGSYELSWSADGETYSAPVAFKPALYEWKSQAIKARCRYMRVRAVSPSAPILELAFWDSSGGALPASVDGAAASGLVDEQSLAKSEASALDSMYFDEIYHGRTAYENIHLIDQYEWTHPPLGKLIISLGIRAFGMNPFGWRIMGLLFGVFLAPLLYAVARAAVPRGPWALCAAGAYAFDFMRFTQTRIGTVDVYVSFFVLASYALMYRYYLSALDPDAKRPDLVSLCLSGLAFSLGAATKWNAIYAGLGLAAIFFTAFIIRARRTRKAGETWAAFGLCFASFIVLPLLVYVASYIPLIRVPGRDWHSIWAWQKQMLSYHSELKATHAFSSPWWQWPAMARPVWYFKGEGLPAGMASTIAAMGNPLVYWPSFVAAAAALWLSLSRRDLRILPVIAGYVSQYLPWILVPRLTFLYHYFPIVPFGLVCLFYCLRPLALMATEARPAAAIAARAGMNRAERRRAAREEERRIAEGQGRAGPSAITALRNAGRFALRNWHWIYVAACAILFILFFPAISGLPVAAGWIKALRWFPSWVF